MKPLIFLSIIASLLTSCRKVQTGNSYRDHPAEHSLFTELLDIYDISLLPEYKDSTYCAQVSTWDTTGGNDDGFNGRYSFLKRNPDSSLVIFAKTGSGVIHRIWTPTPTMDTLDFYLDQDQKPSFSIQYADLFSGKKYPFIGPLCGNQLGGFYCYLPIPFEKSCRIISRGRRLQFHQIQYRMYEPGERVRSFNIQPEDSVKALLDKISVLWNNKNRNLQDLYSKVPGEFSGKVDLEPGKTTGAFELNQGGRILGFELSPARAFEGSDKNIDIKITWDGEENPAVFCPIADFFGYAFGTASMQSLLMGTRDNKNYCYFPMPFDKKAKIELVYRKNSSLSTGPVQVSVTVWYSSDKRIPEKEGKFYAFWNKDRESRIGKPHIFLDIEGKGHYVGSVLQAQGMVAGMTYFFEGDDSAAVDGEFRIHGTGSEDYFNGGWYAMMDRWDGKMSLPIHGALGYSLPFCRTGGYRFYLSDKISFEKSIFMSIEHGPAGNAFPVDYTSVAMYYSGVPAENSTQPAGELSHVFVPDTLILYPQLADLNLFGNMKVETTWKYGTGGESYLFTPGAESWLRFSLADIPDEKYSLYMDLMMEPYGCEFSVWQRQTRISDWIPTSREKEERVRNLYLCDLDLPENASTITLRFRTDSHKRSLLLNRLILVRNQD